MFMLISSLIINAAFPHVTFILYSYQSFHKTAENNENSLSLWISPLRVRSITPTVQHFVTPTVQHFVSIPQIIGP